MKLTSFFIAQLLLAPIFLFLWGCRRTDRQDTVIASAANASHTYRATILLRQYFLDGRADTSPTTYVLLDKDSDKDSGKPDYRNGEDFKDSQVVMKPSQCGSLNVQWADDHVLKVICEKCGLALTAVGQHASGMGSIRVEYEGFPEVSSWEAAPGAN